MEVLLKVNNGACFSQSTWCTGSKGPCGKAQVVRPCRKESGHQTGAMQGGLEKAEVLGLSFGLYLVDNLNFVPLETQVLVPAPSNFIFLAFLAPYSDSCLSPLVSKPLEEGDPRRAL